MGDYLSQRRSEWEIVWLRDGTNGDYLRDGPNGRLLERQSERKIERRSE
jgi:hypothetical protein